MHFDLKERSGERTFHYGREIDDNSMIILEKNYTARNFLNILRARTFRSFPAAYFINKEKKYEVTI